ncbi:MAG: DUF6320 domain-containing protein [Christensenellaceae bacterium]|jgi:hypothetical protein|nr:DUF6320 domain-containing protein [Christensenellaceae bacterium]
MKCPVCNTEIACRAIVCPLCHASLDDGSGIIDEARILPRFFPPRGKMPALATTLFDRVYLLIATIFAVSALTVFIYVNMLRFFFVVLAGLFYIYLLVRNTIIGTNHFTQKVVIQTVALTVIAFTLPPAFTQPLVIYEYILPIIYLISIILIGVFVLANFKLFPHHLINLIFVAILGIYPFVTILLSTNSNKVANIIIAAITATIAAMIILLSLIFSSKRILSELKRIFHV